jgi:uracil-DNA glycosylase
MQVVTRGKLSIDVIPLPHPSGASTWPRAEPGKTLTARALALIGNHPAWRALTNA